MQIHGFQKMTLLDFPGKVAATVFTGGCNFRCPFCHNALLVENLAAAPVFDEEEVLAHLAKKAGLLDGVAITGGEPMLQKDLPAFLEKLRGMGYAVKLDTNGSFPDRLKDVVKAGLVDYVAVDIKNRPEKYAETVGVKDFDLAPVRETVDFLLTGAVDYEFRTTVVRQFHTVSDIEAAAEWIRGARRYFLQNFVDSGNLLCPGLTGVEAEEMRRMAAAAGKILPAVALRGVE